MSQEIATLDRVRAAAESLRQRNVRPTADKVIEVIGGGSKGRVLEHLRTLRKTPQEEQGPPQMVLDLARAALAEIYDAGRQAEADRGRTASERLPRIIEEQDAEIQEFSAGTDRLESRLSELTSQADRYRAEIEHLRKSHSETEGIISGLREELDAARSSTASSLVSALTRVERLVQRGQIPARGTSTGRPSGRTHGN